MIGRGKTFRITRLQMERIISSKGPKYSLAWCGALLREQRVSHHLPHRKSKRIQHCNNRHKTWMREAVREHLKGSGDAVTKLSVSFSCIYFTYIWILSASPTAVTSCGFIVHGLLSSTLVINVSTSIPPTPQHNNTKMLTCSSTDPVETMRWITGVTVWGDQESIF